MKIYNDIKAFATAKGAKLILGSNYFQSLHANKMTLAEGQILLGADFNAEIERANNVVQSITYNGVIIVGRKFEAASFSSVAETFEEKLNARLNDLIDIAIDWIGEFACMYGYAIKSERAIMQLNEFASNIDFVAIEITLADE